jgi:hypothetical protein
LDKALLKTLAIAALRPIRVGFTILGAFVTLLIIALWFLTWNGANGISISGKVLDSETGKPVPNAHVIVRYQPAGFMVDKRFFGIVADESGQFGIRESIVLEPEFGLEFQASGAGGEYGKLSVDSPPIDDGWIRSEVTISVKKLADPPVGSPYERYEMFCPRGVRPRSLRFLGSGWTIPDYKEPGQ